MSKRTNIIFACVLVVYIAILSLGVWQVKCDTKERIEYYDGNHTDDEAVSAFMEAFADSIRKGEIPEGMEIPDYINDFEDKDILRKLYLESVDADSLTIVRTYDSGNASVANDAIEPQRTEYVIESSGKPVSKVSFISENKETVLDEFTVKTWRKTSVEPYLTYNTYSVKIKVPEGFEVQLNGQIIDEGYLCDYRTPIEEFGNIEEYVEMPDFVYYEVSGLISEACLVIKDNYGEIVEESKENYFYSAYFEENEMPEDLMETALSYAQTWSLFCTNDASLDKAKAIFPKGSYYETIAKRWVKSADRTYTSTHTLDDPKFRVSEADEYVRYNDNCFSCHIYLEKIMHLSRNGNVRLDVTDMTFYFVYIDDTDDGKDNPRWVIADMVTKSENHPTVP